jgi:hypothetical protein
MLQVLTLHASATLPALRSTTMPWDQILVYAIIAAAALYLARGLFRRAKGDSCGGCHGCGSTKEPNLNGTSRSDLIHLDVTPREKT